MPKINTDKKTAEQDATENSDSLSSQKKWNGKLSEDKLDITAARSSGNGGQNVNKVSTKAIIRFDVLNCDDLSLEEKTSVLKHITESRPAILNSENIVIISSQETRSFNENRKRAIIKLEKLITEALIPKKIRIKTQTPESAVQTRLEDKKRKQEIKKQRAEKPTFD
jgi:ribosome-associated protein